MTEFESYEAAMLALEMSVSASMNFTGYVFAYLVAAHVVGKSLPRNVAIGMSIIYTMFLVVPFSGAISNLHSSYEAHNQILEHFPDSWTIIESLIPFQVLAFLWGLPMLVGWLGSVYYMHGFARSENKTDA
jgi:hypothetical protein